MIKSGTIAAIKSRLKLEQENSQIQGELAEVPQQLVDKETTLEQLKEALILARNARFAAVLDAKPGCSLPVCRAQRPVLTYIALSKLLRLMA